MINSLDIQKGLLSFMEHLISYQKTLVRVLNFTLFWFSFAYIEFTDKESVDNAVNLDESLFKGRQIKVQNLKLENVLKVLFSVISR